jgi:hypothetical protein
MPVVALALAAAFLAAGRSAAWAGPIATPAVPATVAAQVAPRPDAAATLQPVLELELGSGTRGADEAVLRIFVDTPEADAATPLADPGYVGSVSTLAGEAGGWAGQRFALPLAGAFFRLAARPGSEPPPPRAPSVTVVPVPLRGGAGADVAVEIASVAIVWR